jgi:hypothetical protein
VRKIEKEGERGERRKVMGKREIDRIRRERKRQEKGEKDRKRERKR